MPDRCTDNPRDCPLVPRVEALERANEQHSATHREIFGRLGTLESMTAVQDTQLKNMDTKLDDIKNDNKSILAKIEALEEKRRHYEGILRRQLDDLNDEFSTLQMFSQDLQVRVQRQERQKKAA